MNVTSSNLTNLGNRLREVREVLENSDQTSVSTGLMINRVRFEEFENGNVAPDLRDLSAFSTEFNVNLNWLINGQGEMFTEQAETATVLADRLHPREFDTIATTGGPAASSPEFRQLYASAATTVDAQIRQSGVPISVHERLSRVLEEFDRIESLRNEDLIKLDGQTDSDD